MFKDFMFFVVWYILAQCTNSGFEGFLITCLIWLIIPNDRSKNKEDEDEYEYY